MMRTDSAAVREFLRHARPFWGLAAVFAVTLLGVALGVSLPAELVGLARYGPYAVLAVAAGLAWWFNRGRSFVLAATLLLAWGLFNHLHGKAVYLALVILVPANLLAALLVRERGARFGPALRWLAVLALEALLFIWLAKSGVSDQSLSHWLVRSPPAPLLGRLAFAAAMVAAIWRAYPEHRPLDVAHAGALAAFFIGAEWAASYGVFAAFMAAAGALLVVALLQESHALAFRDELTGLLGRRALQERLRGLGARYVLAMVDVDHFKQFNDTHGHDVGDQVLKLVAARLGEIGGGGVAYRYGGEEFSVLFADRTLREAKPHLEAVRAAIESYRMALRGEDRPRRADDTSRLRINKQPEKTVSVTVSIGAAQPGKKHRTPAQVLKAADEALYRAKQSGRNRLAT